MYDRDSWLQLHVAAFSCRGKVPLPHAPDVVLAILPQYQPQYQLLNDTEMHLHDGIHHLTCKKDLVGSQKNISRAHVIHVY